MAAQNGKLEVCRFLLDNKANPTSIDSDGNSPLLLATAADHAGLKKICYLNFFYNLESLLKSIFTYSLILFFIS